MQGPPGGLRRTLDTSATRLYLGAAWRRPAQVKTDGDNIENLALKREPGLNRPMFNGTNDRLISP
jgi:hypothetical protein